MDRVKIYPNVYLGNNVVLHDWVILGLPPKGTVPGELETIIEDNAVIRSHSVIYAGSRIESGFQTGHRAIIGPGSEIGKNCSVGTNCLIQGFMHLQDGAKINSRCSIGIFSVIQEKAWIGPVCTFEGHPNNPVIVASGAILGTTIYVSAGVRIGERSLIAAGTYLNTDVSPYHLVAGHPGRSVKDITRLSCPYSLIDRPYEPDSQPRQKEVLASHKTRSKKEYSSNTWRHYLWKELGQPTIFF